MTAPYLTVAERPRIVGVVNMTEDSFSDGGLYVAPEDALAHAARLRSDGADVIELGPASSHPDAERVSAEEERRRLAPVIERLVAERVPVSIDSFRTTTNQSPSWSTSPPPSSVAKAAAAK
jgi:dihydropteroate synthase type 2